MEKFAFKYIIAFMRWSRIVRIILIIVIAASINGCASTQCSINADAAKENLPVRTVTAVIAIPDADPTYEQIVLFEKSFSAFFEQTGIRIVIQDWIRIEWHGSSRTELLQQLFDEMHRYEKPFDIAIGFYDMNPLEEFLFSISGGWMGAIDDVYRRYIVAKRDNIHLLVHELGHAFLFEHAHTGGVMTAFQLCVISDYVCTNSTVCFLDSDREMILQNKWRDFNVKPELNEKQDLIDGYDYAKTFLRAIPEAAITFIKNLFTPAPPPAPVRH